MRYPLRSQSRSAARKIEIALRRGWRPGAGPVCSYGTKRRARRQEGEQ